MGVTRGDKDCPGRVWVAGAWQDGQKRADVARAPSTSSRLPEMIRGTSPRGEQVPVVSQLFCLASCCFSCERNTGKSLPSVPSASSSSRSVPPLALGEQDPGSNVPLGSATCTPLCIPSSCCARRGNLDALKVPGLSPPPIVTGRLLQPVSHSRNRAPPAPCALPHPRTPTCAGMMRAESSTAISISHRSRRRKVGSRGGGGGAEPQCGAGPQS